MDDVKDSLINYNHYYTDTTKIRNHDRHEGMGPQLKVEKQNCF